MNIRCAIALMFACFQACIGSIVCAGETKGYRDVAAWGDGFVAVGSNGRADILSTDGRVVRSLAFADSDLICVVTDGDAMVAADVNGSLWASFNGGESFEEFADNGGAVFSLAFADGTLLVGGEKGRVSVFNPEGMRGEADTGMTGSVISILPADETVTYVSDEGEIAEMNASDTWEHMDFNELYADYYAPCSFVGAAYGGRRTAVAAIDITDGSPVLYMSTRGTVWSPRSLDYSSDGATAVFDERPTAIIYDEVGDMFVVAGSGGGIISVPACSHCNRRFGLSDVPIRAMAINNNVLLAVGDGYSVATADNW